MTKLSAKIHKWVALVLVAPFLFWFVSGLFFSLAPIEKVRSEHVVAKPAPVNISLDVAVAGLARLGASGAAPGEKIELRTMLGRPVALISPAQGRPNLYDLESGRRLSPIPAWLATTIAEQDHKGDLRAIGVARVTRKSTEYRGALPAWRVAFDDGANRAVYVAADSGVVTARRSTLWRVFDFLWSLHILDFKDRTDFNTPLLAGATAVAMIVIVTGIIMLPSRLGYTAWRRRRLREAAPPPR
jgi:antitoxin (DNA-binding transcriptional repressor) of toxin-antitoxin stability system